MENLSGKRLLILGGTRISMEIVLAAREMGIITGVADYNPVEKSPAKGIADEHYEVNILDVDATVKVIQDNQFDGVIVGFNDMLLPYYADICEKAGLPCYGTKKLFEDFTNKNRYKALCKKFSVPTVKEFFPSEEDIREGKNVEFPVLVKPVDSSGSRGISVCYNKDELLDAYEKAVSFSKTKKILFEKYMSGREVTVFWVFQDGKYYVSSIGNRWVKDTQNAVIPLPVGYTYPASVTDKYMKEVYPSAVRMFQECGIQNGMMFMQCKIEDDTCVVYDIGYRLTGSQEYKTFSKCCNYDTMKMLIHFAITGSMGEPDLEKKVNPYLGVYAYNVSTLCAPGTIASVCGVEDVKKMKGVIDSVVAHPAGDVITEKMKGLLAQITVRTHGTCSNILELWPSIDNIQNTIQIVSSENKRLNLKGFVEEEVVLYLSNPRGNQC